MDYQKIYVQLVTAAKQRQVEGYTEMHHIVPKCMGGDNSSSNLVRLTAREHYIAHRLLYKIHRTPSLAHAWFAMCRNGKGQKRYFTSLQYEYAKKAHVRELSKNIGIKNHFYGRKHTAATKEKISIANKGRVKTDETIHTWVIKVASKPKSAEHRLKIGRKGFTTIKNVITGECKRILLEDKAEYDSNLWKNPSAIRQATSACTVCGQVTVNGNIKRWHNENCKHNPSR